MGNAGNVDQFAPLILPKCQPAASQEEKLQSCPFVLEATGIVMVSLPDSFEDYQTPPEHHFCSLNSSNDDQVPAPSTAAVDRETGSGGVRDEELMVADDSSEPHEKRMVDITDNLEKSCRVLDALMVDGNDTGLINSEIRETESGGVGDEELILAMVSDEPKEKRTLDFTNDHSDNLQLLEKKPRVHREDFEKVIKDFDKVIEDANAVLADGKDTELIGSEIRVNETDTEIWGTEAVKTELASSPKGGADEVFVEMPTREQEVHSSATQGNRSIKNIDGLNTKVNVADNNEEEDVDPKAGAFRDLLDHALKILSRQEQGSGNGRVKGVDFYETCKLRGMTFPRTRWSPPQTDDED